MWRLAAGGEGEIPTIKDYFRALWSPDGLYCLEYSHIDQKNSWYHVKERKPTGPVTTGWMGDTYLWLRNHSTTAGLRSDAYAIPVAFDEKWPAQPAEAPRSRGLG